MHVIHPPQMSIVEGEERRGEREARETAEQGKWREGKRMSSPSRLVGVVSVRRGGGGNGRGAGRGGEKGRKGNSDVNIELLFRLVKEGEGNGCLERKGGGGKPMVKYFSLTSCMKGMRKPRGGGGRREGGGSPLPSSHPDN